MVGLVGRDEVSIRLRVLSAGGGEEQYEDNIQVRGKSSHSLQP